MTTPTPDTNASRWTAALVGCATAVAVLAIAVNALRAAPAASPATPVGDGDLCRAIGDAYLSGTLYGALDQVIDWRGTDMRCEGGQRPDGAGLRLVFAAPIEQTDARLVFVIAIDGRLNEIAGTERVANITIIDESSGRFFSTGRRQRCWTAVGSVERDGGRIRIGGEVYCAGSVPSVSDTSSLSLRDFRYAGLLNLDAA